MPFDRPPALGIPGEKAKPLAPTESAPEPAETPDDAAIQPNPAAVGYRTEAESCSHCTYFEREFCSHPMLGQAVSAGDSCAAFEAGGATERPMGAEPEGEFIQ